jgi:hypothetical protein
MPSGILETLTRFGISGIALTSAAASRADIRNTINRPFSFVRTDGTTGQGADVSFAVGPDAVSSRQSNDALRHAMAAFDPAEASPALSPIQPAQVSDVALVVAH